MVQDIPAGTAEDYYNRGNKYREQGNLDQAIYDYSKAIKANSKYSKAYYNRANSYVKQGKLAEAIEDYTKAVEINPLYTEAYYNMGNTYEKQGDLEHAVEWMQARVDYERATGHPEAENYAARVEEIRRRMTGG